MSGWYLSKEPSHEYIRELNSPPVRHRGKPQKAIRGQKKGTTMLTYSVWKTKLVQGREGWRNWKGTHLKRLCLNSQAGIGSPAVLQWVKAQERIPETRPRQDNRPSPAGVDSTPIPLKTKGLSTETTVHKEMGLGHVAHRVWTEAARKPTNPALLENTYYFPRFSIIIKYT